MSAHLDRLPALAIFARIAQYQSMAAAARALGMSRSTVSKQLSQLEEKLNMRLIQRSTRKLRLTEAGERVLPQAQAIAEALNQVEILSEQSSGTLRGELKISCTTGLGKTHLVPLMEHFSQRYPLLRTHLLLEDRLADMIAEQVDVSIRIGHLPNSSLVARPLGTMRLILTASPAYLKAHGTPHTPADLKQHDCLIYRNDSHSLNRWLFYGPHGEERIDVEGKLQINDATALISAAKKGMGVLLIDRAMLGTAIEDGELVPLLSTYRMPEELTVYALYPARAQLPEKSRVFVDFLLEEFAPKLI